MVEPRIGFWWWWATWVERLPFLARHVLGERSPRREGGAGSQAVFGLQERVPTSFSFFFFLNLAFTS